MVGSFDNACIYVEGSLVRFRYSKCQSGSLEVEGMHLRRIYRKFHLGKPTETPVVLGFRQLWL